MTAPRFPKPRPTLRADYQLSDRYTRDHGSVFLTGIQALARLPLEQLRADRAAGLRTAAFVSGYPGSPLGGYDKAVASAARQASDLPISCRPALNEEYAATAVMGSQLAAAQADSRYDGVVGIWYGKAPGVDRASDALRHAVYAGSSQFGGAIALVGDDPGAKSSTLPSSSAGSLFDMHIPVLYPGDPGEALDLGRHAIALARCTGLWVGLKIVADVADGSATIWLDLDRVQPKIPLHNGKPYVCVPDGKLLTPHTLELEREIYEVRYALAMDYASANHLNYTKVDPPDAWIGLVSSGITYREVREALRRLGLNTDSQIADAGIRLLKMQMPLPFNPTTMRDFARGLKELFVIEEKQPNLESLVKDALYNLTERPRVVGKFDEQGGPLLPGHGGLSADDILPALRGRLAGTLGDRLAPELLSNHLLELHAPQTQPEALTVRRTPFYCSGCPHNRSTEVPSGSLVGAGIGCHTMTMLMDPRRVGDIAGLTCMGNEGVQWIGMSEFVEQRHMLQNLGDGTFFHSGQLAIQAAVAAGVPITYKLLWNGAVAMTGGQAAPGRTSIASVAQILLIQGVTRVLVTSDDVSRTAKEPLPDGVEVWDRSRLMEAQEQLARVDGVTVLIHDQACAAESRRARKRGLAPTPNRQVAINIRVCEGCGDCGRISNCLSVQPIQTPFGRKTTIDTGSCNLDFSCLEGDCPSFMTVSKPPAWQLTLRRWWRGVWPRDPAPEPVAPKEISPPGMEIPEPSVVVANPDDFATRMTGIGGTGVVTVSQVLGTAAAYDGFEVRGLDQIGLSQKAGPVVSDLRLRRGRPAETNRIGAGGADLLLAFDALAASSPAGLLVAAPEKTAVVGSTSGTPTGAMITRPAIELPDGEELKVRIAPATRPDQQHWADAAAITKALLGESVTSNIFVVGMAVQAGCLPIRPESIERALQLNGVSVEANLAAFRWGRLQIASPDTVASAVTARQMPASKGSAQQTPDTELSQSLLTRIDSISGDDAELEATLRLFSRNLIDHQDIRSADRFVSTLAHVARCESDTLPGSHQLTRAVASGLHKLMAYKDEYEVARLLLSAEGLASAREIAGESERISWLLHPPLLRALGMRRKIRVGLWAAPAMAWLAAAKRLRTTPLDPFGWTRLRRIERSLPGEYCTAIERVLRDLKPTRLDDAIAIARLPSDVRGYEDIKLANIKRYQQKMNELLDRFECAVDTQD